MSILGRRGQPSHWSSVDERNNPFGRDQFGGTFAGRLVRDKLFMTNVEVTRDVKTTQRVSSVATNRMRAGDFSGAGVDRLIFDPLTRVYSINEHGLEQAVSAQQFRNNAVPPSRFNPGAEKLLNGFYPQQTEAGDLLVRITPVTSAGLSTRSSPTSASTGMRAAIRTGLSAIVGETNWRQILAFSNREHQHFNHCAPGSLTVARKPVNPRP